MKFILGKKISMTQIFKEDEVVPATIIEAGPCFVTQIKNKENDNYEAIQIGFKKLKDKKVKRSMKGKEFRYLKEFTGDVSKYKIGDEIKADVFAVGDKLKISGVSKGLGFQGVVKRHHFHGAPKTHGTKHALRSPGSIGATAPQRVFKGMRMAGRMGGERVSIKNLEIIEIQPEKNLLIIKGAVPGARNGLLEIRSL